MEKTSGVVKEKLSTLLLGIFCVAIFIGSFIYTSDLKVIIVGVLFGLIGINLILSYFKYRIEFDDEGFTYSNTTVKPTRYSYDQITVFDIKGGKWKLYIGRLKIRLDNSHENREAFKQVIIRHLDNSKYTSH